MTPLAPPTLEGTGALKLPFDQATLHATVRAALQEDGAFHDLTTIATVVSDRRARGTLVVRRDGVIAGIPVALETFRVLDSKISIRVDAEDGTRVSAGSTLLYVTGHARALLSSERVALNFLQRLSGIATMTAKFVAAVEGTQAKILDTRKTTPGWRLLEKYAVRAGGGSNHRVDLASAILIKDNHLAALDGDVALAVKRARQLAPTGMQVEIECDTLEQVDQAIAANVDVILLDNMSVADMRVAVGRIGGRALVEASGGVTLANVRRIAETGVDWISVGALTHSVEALDMALEFE